MSELILMLLATALFQNILLTTGFGSSLLLRVIHKKSDIWQFGLILSGFLVATVLIDYPIDLWLGLSIWAKLLRPVVMVAIASVLYCLVTVITARISLPAYKKIKPYMVPAVFNDLTIGLAMVANHKVALSLWGTLGLALGTCLGFMLMAWLTLEGRSRLNQNAVPLSFRGVPVTLLYLGLIALALLGFGSGGLL
ncbi:MAG: hypothetical protein J6R77_08015 [Clostridia bacterium]|nr:hypothetical protein [Clostridia bacterium]